MVHRPVRKGGKAGVPPRWHVGPLGPVRSRAERPDDGASRHRRWRRAAGELSRSGVRGPKVSTRRPTSVLTVARGRALRRLPPACRGAREAARRVGLGTVRGRYDHRVDADERHAADADDPINPRHVARGPILHRCRVTSSLRIPLLQRYRRPSRVCTPPGRGSDVQQKAEVDRPLRDHHARSHPAGSCSSDSATLPPPPARVPDVGGTGVVALPLARGLRRHGDRPSEGCCGGRGPGGGDGSRRRVDPRLDRRCPAADARRVRCDLLPRGADVRARRRGCLGGPPLDRSRRGDPVAVGEEPQRARPAAGFPRRLRRGAQGPGQPRRRREPRDPEPVTLAGRVARLLDAAGWRFDSVVGIRLFSDPADDDLPDRAFEQLLRLEREAGRRSPYRDVARLIHIAATAVPT